MADVKAEEWGGVWGGPGASVTPYTGNFAFIIFLILILIIFGMGLFGPGLCI